MVKEICIHATIQFRRLVLLKEHGSTGQEKNRIIKCIILIETSKNRKKKKHKRWDYLHFKYYFDCSITIIKKNKFK